VIFDEYSNYLNKLKSYLIDYNNRSLEKIISTFKNLSFDKRNKNNSINIFRFLYPLYFPDIKDLNDVREISKNQFKEKVKNVIIIGNSKRSYDFKYVLKENLIDYRVIDMDKLNKSLVYDFDLFIINSKLSFVKDFYYKILNISDKLPIYTLI